MRVHYPFKGISAHAGTSPHLGRSALDALEFMNMGVQFLKEHIIPEARIHYAITNTGGAAMMCGVEVQIETKKAYSNILVNRALEKVLHDNMNAVPLPEHTEDDYHFTSAIQETVPGRPTMADRLERTMGEKVRQIGEAYDKKSIYRFVLPYQPSEKPISDSSDVGDVSWVCTTSQIVAVMCAGGTPKHTITVILLKIYPITPAFAKNMRAELKERRSGKKTA